MLFLRTGLPVFWVTPTTLQFGVEAPNVRLRVSEPEAEALFQLPRGLSPETLLRAAGSDHRAVELQEALGDVLAPEPPDIRIRVLGEIPLASAVRGIVAAAGLGAGRQPANALVSVATWELTERDWQRTITKELPHLPVVVTDRSAQIGPFWLPGVTACRRCIRPTGPDALPLPADRAATFEFSSFEQAGILGAVAQALADFVEGEHASRLTIVYRNGQVAREPTQRRPECPCAIDDPRGESLPGEDQLEHQSVQDLPVVQGILRADGERFPTTLIA